MGSKASASLLELVFLEQLGVEAFDGDAVLEVFLEALLVGFLELLDAIGGDVPIEDFLVDVGEEDAGGEFREVRVLFDEGLGVEDDGGFEILGGNFRADGAAEFALDLLLGEVEVEADGGELDALFQLHAVPEGGIAIRSGDDDHGILREILGGVFLILGAQAAALGTVEDVVLGGLVVALAHEFLLDVVLDVLDVDEGLVALADEFGDGVGDLGGGLGVLVDGEEGLADGDLDLGLAPRHDVAIAADEADGKGVGAGAGLDVAGLLEGAAEGEGFGDVVGVVFEEGFFDEEVEVGLGEAEAVAFFEGFREGNGDVAGDLGDEVAVVVGEDGGLVLGSGRRGGR